MFPKTTRLRWVKAKRPETIQAFCDNLDKRIESKVLSRTATFGFCGSYQTINDRIFDQDN